MIAKMKCSNCGAEISNLNMSWGRKYWMFAIPIMLLGFLPILRMTFFKGDPVKELAISEIQKRTNGQAVEVLGLVTNSGSRQWSSITIKAEFFDASGTFIDEQSHYLQSTLAAGAKDHFKLILPRPDPRVQNADTRMEVKISGGMNMPF